MKLFVSRLSSARSVAAGIAAVVAGSLLVLGLSAPASAGTTGVNFTVDLTTKAGKPLSGIKVYAVQVTDGHGVAGDPEPEANAVSKEAGFYAFTGASQLQSGTTYSLYFRSPDSAKTATGSSLLGGSNSLDRAETFVAGTDRGEITFLSASLSTNSTIKGVVKAATGKALKGAYVDIYTYNGDTPYDYDEVKTSSSGAYLFTDLEPGSYKLEVYYPGETHPPVFSGGAASLDAAAGIQVGLGQTVSSNVSFPAFTGGIVGTALVNYYDSDGTYEGQEGLYKALPAAYPVTASYNGAASAIDADRVVYGTRVARDGSYSIKGLGPGNYVVRMFPWYYNEQADYVAVNGDSASFTGAQIINVGTYPAYADEAVFGINPQGASLTVKVSGPSGSALSGAHVLLQREADPDEYYSAKTSATGTVTFGVSGKNAVIRPGDFTLSVVGPDQTTNPYYLQTYSLAKGSNSQNIQLSAVTTPPGFYQPPSIAQTATTVGTSYTVSAYSSLGNATLDYVWYRDDKVIYGATTATYQSRASDIGTQLSVRVEVSTFGFDPVYATADVQGLVTAPANRPQVVSPPTLSPAATGAANPGTELTATPGVWDTPGLTYSYHWTKNGDPIDDTTSHYLVQLADLGDTFAVSVSASEAGYQDGLSTAAPSTITPTEGDKPIALAPLVITSKVKGSTTYTVAPGKWTGLDPTFTYVWTRGTATVGTGASYVEANSKTALADPLAVEVTATEDGFTNPGRADQLVRKASAPLTAKQDPPTATVVGGTTPLTASTTLAADQTVTVAHGTWSGILNPDSLEGLDDSITYSYQWYSASGSASPKAIAGATLATYAVPVTLIGKKLSVIVTAHSTLWASGVSGRLSVGTVAAATALVDEESGVSIPVGSGTAAAGALVWPSPTWGKWANDASAITYQWYVCDLPACSDSAPKASFVAVKNATDIDFTVPSTPTGARVFLRVTATRTGFTTASVDTNVIQVAPNNVLMLGAPTFTNFQNVLTTPKVGTWSYVQAIQDDNPYNSATSVHYTTLVQTCSSDCSSPDADWHAVDGTIVPAVQNSYPQEYPEYTPDVADYANGNGWLRIVETASATGFLDASVTSTPVKIGPGTYSPPSGTAATLVQTAGTDDSSKTFSVSAQSYLGTVPTVQWYEGTTALDGDTQVVENPTVAGVPEYAIVTWDIPGYNEISQILVARYLPYPGSSAAPESIIGTTYGQPLQLAVADPWGLAGTYPAVPGTLTYAWSSSSSTDTPSFTPGPESVGSRVEVDVTYVSPLFAAGRINEYVDMASPLLGLPIEDSANTPTLQWTGPLVSGTSLSVTSPHYSPSDVTTSYQWQVKTSTTSWTNIYAATAASYTPSIYLDGDQLRVVVTGSKPGYVSLVEDSEAETVQWGDAVEELEAPALPATARVGETLTLNPGSWSTKTVLQIQWLLNGVAIPGATGTSCVPLAANEGNEISARVTGATPGQISVTDTSNRVTIGTGAAPTQLVASKITGKGTASSPLTVSTGSWSVGGLQYSYAWTDGKSGDPISTTNTLVLPAGDAIGDIHVTITAKLSGYEDATVTVP